MANNGSTSFQGLLPPTGEFSLEEQASSWGSTPQLGNVALSSSGFPEAAPSSWEAKVSSTERAGNISSTGRTKDLFRELKSIVTCPGTSPFPPTTAKESRRKAEDSGGPKLDQEIACPWGWETQDPSLEFIRSLWNSHTTHPLVTSQQHSIASSRNSA